MASTVCLVAIFRVSFTLDDKIRHSRFAFSEQGEPEEFIPAARLVSWASASLP